MALWLFRLRGSRKHSRTGAALSDTDSSAAQTTSLAGGIVRRTASKRKQRAEPSRPPRLARTYSFSPDRQDSIHIDRPVPSGASQNGRMAGVNAQDPAWDEVPTLHRKRSSNHLMRRKSSKRRREDYNREAEIKAMSSFVPVRAATDALTTGRPISHGHKRAKTVGAGRAWDNPASEVSLPLPGSIRSSFSSESDFVSYKVSALDSLAPRPTLRYAQGSRSLPSRASAPTRSGSQKRTLADREPIPEETLRAHKRIDDLANDFDASELRELMERDARRRERQRQHERERMERRLARKAEKQRRQEAEARKTGTPHPENLERGVMGRELVGLGIDPPSTVVTSSTPRISLEPTAAVHEESAERCREETPRQPLESFHPTDTAAQQDLEVSPSTEEPSHSAAESKAPISAIPPGFRLGGTLRSKISVSKSTLDSDREKAASTIDDDAATRKDSVASSKTNRLSFSTFLRWGTRSRRNSGGPSSFSNTSREEMAAAAQAQVQAQTLAKMQGDDVSALPPPTPNYIMSKPGSGAPKRTRSRFREDLPELPLSPPHSRIQSPEAEPLLPIVAEHRSANMQSAQLYPARPGTPTSGRQSTEASRPIPIPPRKAHGAHSSEPPLSMSLASIDSEGSWLSGKVGSQRMASIRDNLARSRRHDRVRETDSPNHSEQEDVDMTEDDYMSRPDPNSNATGRRNRSSGEFRSGGDGDDDDDELMEEDDDVRWGAVGAHPQLIRTHRHDRETFHSREGLLNVDSGDEEDLESPVSTVSPVSDKVDLERARSVCVGPAHARNFSAGSAKLLDIGPRASVDRSQETADDGHHQHT